MKRRYCLILILCCLLIATKGFAYDFEVDGLCYNKLSDSTVELTWKAINAPYTGDVVVPSLVNYNGEKYEVVAIGEYAMVNVGSSNDEGRVAGWSNNSKLSSVTLPSTILSIGNHAFEGCSALTSITIPNSVTSIGNAAFSGCSGLTSITIPNSVTSIGYSAFSGCYGLSSIKVDNNNKNYDSRNNCNAIIETLTNTIITGCKNTTIPNSVTSIGNAAFKGCNGLSSIKVDNNNKNYDSRNNCNAIIETSTNTIISGCKNTTIPNSVTNIGNSAFSFCSSLTSITIPNSVTSIGNSAFYGCSGLTSITIPNSVTSIGTFAFWSGLTSVISEIVNPFEIADNIFSSDTYSKAKLTVPAGTMSKYQSTNYWNKFTNIEEKTNEESSVSFTLQGITYLGTTSTSKAEVQAVDISLLNVEIPSSVTYSGKTYQVNAIASDVLSYRTYNYVSLPSTITSITSSTFSNSNLGALIWNANSSLSSSVFSNMAVTTGSNFLLYVNSKSYAPSNVKNVVVGNTANSITLSDATNTRFYCPKEFTVQTISYTHQYSMTTGGNGKGWETISLPFDVNNIVHSSKGVLTPFALYQKDSGQRPFWLYELGNDGFKRAKAIKANTPYIISMPNNSIYDSEYILSGDVTFSATNAKVYQTSSLVSSESNGKKFVPSYEVVNASPSVYPLNVTNNLVTYTGIYDEGSKFIGNLRKVYPFEAYMTTSDSSNRVLKIEFEDETTGIMDVSLTKSSNSVVTVYSLNGQQVKTGEYQDVMKHLSKGIYIVNGRKVVVK